MPPRRFDPDATIEEIAGIGFVGVKSCILLCYQVKESAPQGLHQAFDGVGEPCYKEFPYECRPR